MMMNAELHGNKSTMKSIVKAISVAKYQFHKLSLGCNGENILVTI